MLDTKERRLEFRNALIRGRKTEKYNNLEYIAEETTKGERKVYTLTLWRGTSAKPSANYYYYSETQRNSAIEYYKKISDKNLENRKKRTESKSAQEQGIKVNDIFYCSWGYDQTNYDYIAIIGISSSGKTVTAQRTTCKNIGVNGTSNVQKPLLNTFGDIFTLQVRDGYLIGSYPFCHDGNGSKRRGYFSKHLEGRTYHETMSQFGH